MKDIKREVLQKTAIIALVLLVLAFAVQQTRQTFEGESGEETETLEEKITRITEENPYVRNLRLNEDFERTVELISQEELAVLKLDNELYKRLPDKDLYRIYYDHYKQGRYFAMLDLETEEVILFYRLSGVNVS